MTVKQTADGKWIVLDDDGRVIAEFESHRAAWHWIDKHERRALWARRETADWRGHGVYYDE